MGLLDHPDFECPHCGEGVHQGDIPDHIEDGMRNGGHFDFECDCGCKFNVDVGTIFTFSVDEDTIELPETPAEKADAD